MKFCIIILNWNAPADTIRSACSFLDNGVPSEQILLVDNASNDDSVEQFRNRLPDVQCLVSEENLGYAGGNNLGIRYALDQGADTILVVNNDTVLTNLDFINYAIDFFERNPRVGLLGPTVRLPSGEIQKTILAYPTLWQTIRNTLERWMRCWMNDYSASQSVKAVSGVCFLARAKVFRDVGLLDESYFMYAEEQDYCFRVKKTGWDIRYEPIESITHYHMDGDPTPERRARKYFYSRRNRVRFCWKNKMPVQSIVMAVMLLVSLLIKTGISPLRGEGELYRRVWSYLLRKNV